MFRGAAGSQCGRHNVAVRRLLGEGVRQSVRALRQEGLRHVQGGAL